MANNNIVLEKSFAFAVRIVKLCKYLREDKHERVLSRQILRSGTSIGANVEEAVGAQSHKDFISKVSIAHKENRETNYWLRLLHETEYLSDTQFNSLHSDCLELQNIISAILITAKKREKQKK